MAAAPRQRRTSSATDAPTLRPRKGDDLLLRPFQREDVDFIKRNNYRVLVANAPGTGKAQPLDAKVLTSTGWTSIGALRVGDKVIDPDGGTAEVLGVFPQGVKKVYRVTVAGGGSTECCAEHLWTVQTNRDKRTKRSRTLTLSALRASGLERLATAKNPWSSAKYFLPSAVPADFAPVDDHDLPLDPYLLGVILGDGSVSAAGNSVGFTSADKDIVEAVRHALPRGVALKEHTRSKYGWRISRETGSQRNTVRAALEYIGVFGKKAEDKGVPGAYLHASQGVRLALLRGLLDTDGDCGKGYATFNTSSPQLAADVAFLVGSLGGFTTTTSRVPTYWHKGEKRTGRIAYRVRIRIGVCPFSLARKATQWRPSLVARGIKAVEYARDAECVCIAVSSKRNLYITDDFIVTHNTPTALGCINGDRAKLTPTLIVCPASVVTNWCREARKWVPGAVIHAIADMATPMPKRKVDVFVTSWSLLPMRYLEILALKPQFIIADECFPAGTRVRTVDGDVCIEDVLPGDRIFCQDSTGHLVQRRVLSVTARALTKYLVRVTHEGGSFVCTGDHKVFTREDGYVAAKDLVGKHVSLLREDVPSPASDADDVLPKVLDAKNRRPEAGFPRNQNLLGVREQFLDQGFIEATLLLPPLLGGEHESSGQDACSDVRMVLLAVRRSLHEPEEVLRYPLLCEVAHDASPHQRGSSSLDSEVCRDAQGSAAPRRSGEDAKEQPDERPRGARASKAQTCREDVPVERREWQDHSGTGGSCQGAEPPDGAPHPNEGRTASFSESAAVLQGGRGVPRHPRGVRGRRENALHEEVEVLGRSEDARLGASRVVRVEVLQRGSACRSPERRGQGEVVYDLEVEEHHNFVADSVVVANCHLAKNADALRTQALSIIAKRAPHMILLSGTPLVNRPAELETIKGLFGQEDEVPMIRRHLEDVLPEIPPKMRSVLPVQLRPKDEGEYRKAEKDFADWLEMELQRRMSQGEALAAAERALAAEALVKTGYLRRLLGLAKVPAAVDWISRAVRVGEPVVVFCEHQEVVARLRTLLTKQRIRHVTIDGGTGRKQRQLAIDTFQAGLVPVFIGTKAAKEGITLTRGRNLLFIERYFTSADEEQAEDRIRRFGQKYPTTIWFLHAEETLDTRLSEIIETKRKLVDETIGSADIEESEEAAVLELISAWHENAAKPHQPTSQATDLGLGKPLPPLPSPNECYRLLFRPPRWTKAAAKAWSAMHGFRPTEIHAVDAGIQVGVLPLDRFVPGKFHRVAISADIVATLGVRRPVAGAKKAPTRPKARSTRSSGAPSQRIGRR